MRKPGRQFPPWHPGTSTTSFTQTDRRADRSLLGRSREHRFHLPAQQSGRSVSPAVAVGEEELNAFRGVVSRFKDRGRRNIIVLPGIAHAPKAAQDQARREGHGGQDANGGFHERKVISVRRPSSRHAAPKEAPKRAVAFSKKNSGDGPYRGPIPQRAPSPYGLPARCCQLWRKSSKITTQANSWIRHPLNFGSQFSRTSRFK